MKKTFFIYQIAKSTAYYAALYALCERTFTGTGKPISGDFESGRLPKIT